MEKGDNNYGKAYVFMDLNAAKKQIEDELPRARELAETPSHLEISVKEVREAIADGTLDQELTKFIHQNEIFPLVSKTYSGPRSGLKRKRMADLRYVMEAKCPNATNEQVSRLASHITDKLYAAFNKGEPFYEVNMSRAPNGQYEGWEED